MREGNRALHRLRPSELADLLEELGRRERQELLAALAPETAADALEEMDAEELESLLRESGEEQAAALLAVMEPDEAVDALRDLEEHERDQLLGMMPEEKAAELRRAPRLRRAHRRRLDDELPVDRAARRHGGGRAGTPRGRRRPPGRPARRAGRGHEGRLVDDISLFELLVAEPDTSMSDLCGDTFPVTVTPEAEIDVVVERFVDERGASLVVVDTEDRPIGRILADDLIDALAPQSRVTTRRRLT